MTTRALIQGAEQYSDLLLGLFLLFPLTALLLGFFHHKGKGGTAPWKYIYALLVYAVCIPGIGAAVLLAYTLFFTRENLLDVNFLIYFLPVASMAVSLLGIGRKVSFEQIPGFDRLSGLMVLLAVTFGIILLVYKTHIGIVFFGSFQMLLALGLAVFALLKWGHHLLLRRREEPRRGLSSFLDR